MATKLNSKIVRESAVVADARPIIVTLNEDQSISLKLKGMKTGAVSIPIEQLYNQLKGSPARSEEAEEDKPFTLIKGEPMISLHKFRNLNAVTKSGIETTAKIDEIIVDILKGK